MAIEFSPREHAAGINAPPGGPIRRVGFTAEIPSEMEYGADDIARMSG